MSDNPHEVRQQGMRRVRPITGWVAAAGVVATGAIAVGVSGVVSAAGATSSAGGGAGAVGDGNQGTTSQTNPYNGTDQSGDAGQPGDGFSPPAQVPGGSSSGSGSLLGGFGGSHASSGGS